MGLEESRETPSELSSTTLPLHLPLLHLLPSFLFLIFSLFVEDNMLILTVFLV